MPKTPSLSEQRAVRSYLEAVRTAGAIPADLAGLDKLPGSDVPGFKARVREVAGKILAAEADGETGLARRIANEEGLELDRLILDDPGEDAGVKAVSSDDIRAMVADLPRGVGF